jgi:hypothetical protein
MTGERCLDVYEFPVEAQEVLRKRLYLSCTPREQQWVRWTGTRHSDEKLTCITDFKLLYHQ